MSVQAFTAAVVEVVRRAEASAQSQDMLGLLRAFNILQVLGFTLNTVIVLTAATNNKRVRRTMVWYLFMIGWIAWCVVYALLFILGYQGPQEPPRGLCLFQAALVYAFPPYMAMLTLGILAQLYCALYASVKQRRAMDHVNLIVCVPYIQEPPQLNSLNLRVIQIILTPLVFFVGVFLAVLVSGIRDPDSIRRGETLMYCNSSNSMAYKLDALLVGLTSILMLMLESVVIVTFFNYWSSYARIRTVPGNVLSGTMAFRIIIFSFMPMIALILAVVALLNQNAQGPSNVVIATLPTIAALIFGTQKEVTLSWVFWKRNRLPSESVPRDSSVERSAFVRKKIVVAEV